MRRYRTGTRKFPTEAIEESSDNTKQEYKKKPPWWHSSSSSQSNQICLERSEANLAQHLVESGDVRERKSFTWATASNLDQARAGLAQRIETENLFTALEGSAKPKEENNGNHHYGTQ